MKLMYVKYSTGFSTGYTEGFVVKSYFFIKSLAFSKIIKEISEEESVKENGGKYFIEDIKIL